MCETSAACLHVGGDGLLAGKLGVTEAASALQISVRFPDDGGADEVVAAIGEQILGPAVKLPAKKIQSSPSPPPGEDAGTAGAAGQRQRGGPADETGQAGGCEAAGRLPGASEAQDPRLAFENDFLRHSSGLRVSEEAKKTLITLKLELPGRAKKKKRF